MVTMPAKTSKRPKKGITFNEMAKRCGCSSTKIADYVRAHGIDPVGVYNPPRGRPLKLFVFSSEDEAYLQATHYPKSNTDEQAEAERIASGWLTSAEIAKRWHYGLKKVIALLTECCIPSKWEHGASFHGRKFYKVPSTFPCGMTPCLTPDVDEDGGDWLKSVSDRRVRKMILDERKWKQQIGRVVFVQNKRTGEIHKAKLLAYNMCVFYASRNDAIYEYKHGSAKVVGVDATSKEVAK